MGDTPEGGLSGGSLADRTLDASGSRDLAAAITQYTWTSAMTGCTIATGMVAKVSVPTGVNDVRLEAKDAAGNVSVDEVVIAVAK